MVEMFLMRWSSVFQEPVGSMSSTESSILEESRVQHESGEHTKP